MCVRKHGSERVKLKSILLQLRYIIDMNCNTHSYIASYGKCIASYLTCQFSIVDEDEVDYIERQLNARTLGKLKGKYAVMIENIRNIFEGKNLDVNSLILKLSSIDDDNITIFSTDRAFRQIHSIDDLFIHIGNHCSIYDYELLVAFVEATECQEAIKVLDDFTKELHSSVLSDLDLLGDDGELQDPKVFTNHKMIIKYVGGKCTIKTKQLVQNIICERFHLNKGSIFFRGVQVGSVNFVYQISSAVKAHIQQFPITAEKVFPEKEKIKCLIIDDEEVKFPVQLEGKAI